MSASVVHTPLEQMRQRLDAKTLTPLVRQVGERKHAVVVSWNCEVVQSGGCRYTGALGVFRVYGVAQDGTERLP
jgi:hypothetical protein